MLLTVTFFPKDPRTEDRVLPVAAAEEDSPTGSMELEISVGPPSPQEARTRVGKAIKKKAKVFFISNPL